MVCKECDREFESLDSLRRHRSQKHNVNAEQTYIDYLLNSVVPKCKCGCGERPKYLGIDAGFREYKWGHAARVNNNWGHNPNAIKKSHDTQKRMYENGELVIWNKGLTIEDDRVRNNIEKVISNPNRGKNISDKLIGVPKIEEHRLKIKEKSKKRWESIEEREKQSERKIKWLINNNYNNKKTELECLFQTYLESFNLIENYDFIYQYQLGLALYDFYLIKYNIIIEVDGDFHHCNPNSEHSIPAYPIQFKTVANDLRKNRIAESKNIKLIRFWEMDIKNNKESVIKLLKNELGL
jgi:very-short-patch-repair endonuclease